MTYAFISIGLGLVACLLAHLFQSPEFAMVGSLLLLLPGSWIVINLAWQEDKRLTARYRREK